MPSSKEAKLQTVTSRKVLKQKRNHRYLVVLPFTAPASVSSACVILCLTEIGNFQGRIRSAACLLAVWHDGDPSSPAAVQITAALSREAALPRCQLTRFRRVCFVPKVPFENHRFPILYSRWLSVVCEGRALGLCG